MKKFLYGILCGFCLGISVFAPGISGSVMAIILGIYDKLLEIVATPFRNFKKNVKFLLPMGIGAIISFILFIAAFSYLFDTYEKATYMLFIGLIAGNLPVVYKQARQVKFRWYFIIGTVITAAFACCMGILSNLTVAPQEAGQSTDLLYLGLAGGLSGFASLVPGMSVSMILIVMNAYETLLAAVKSLDILTVAVVGCAFVLAMVVSSRLIRWVFAKFTGFANFMVLGFLLGSIGGIGYGVFADHLSLTDALVGVLMLAVGLGISLLFVYLGKKVNKPEPQDTEKQELGESNMDCLFCKIIAGEIPSTKVYEDETVLAFRDINPQAPTHILVIPKEHIPSVAGITAENSGVVAHIFEVIPAIAEKEGLTSGYRVVSNCGADAGQTVPHLHFHILGGKELSLEMA